MRKLFCLALLAIFLAYLPARLLAQEESPFIVDPPRVSKTVFINWERIEVVYTVRYLDGYEPVYDRMSPESMSFQPFEIDPEMGVKLQIIRQQKYKEENYLDAVYYLRLIGEKKGNLVLPAQKFFYVRLEPGKPREELEVKEFSTAEFKLRYDDVLTAGADDIIDRVDFGSFTPWAYFWKGLALAGFLVSALAGWAFVFRYQPARKKKNKSSGESPASAAVLAGAIPVTAKEIRKKLLKVLAGLQVSEEEFENLRNNPVKRLEQETALCNALREFLLSNISVLNGSDTAREVVFKIVNLKRSFRRQTLGSLANRLVSYEKSLYNGSEAIFWSLRGDIVFLKQSVRNLRRPMIWWKELSYPWHKTGVSK